MHDKIEFWVRHRLTELFDGRAVLPFPLISSIGSLWTLEMVPFEGHGGIGRSSSTLQDAHITRSEGQGVQLAFRGRGWQGVIRGTVTNLFYRNLLGSERDVHVEGFALTYF